MGKRIEAGDAGAVKAGRWGSGVRVPVGGQVVRPAKNRKTQAIRSGRKRWSAQAELVFLEELAATCNVRAAADAAGFSTTAIYKRRMKYPGFATEWDRCLAQGYARLETQMIEMASDSLRVDAVTGAREGKAVSFADGLNLLKLHRASVKGGAAQRYDSRRVAPDMDSVRASILRKIEAIERADAQKAADCPSPAGEGRCVDVPPGSAPAALPHPNPSPEGEGLEDGA